MLSYAKLTLTLMLLSGLILTTGLSAQAQELYFQFDQNETTLAFSTEYQLNSWRLNFSPYLTTDASDLNLGINEAYLEWRNRDGDFTVDLGRKIITYGPGRYGFPMLGPIGGARSGGYFQGQPGLTAEGYDQIGYSFKWKSLNYHKFYAQVAEDEFRMLLGQRITLDWGHFTFGFSEAALVNDDAPGFYYLPLPFVPVYFYQYIASNIYDIEDVNIAANVAVDFDLTWRPRANFKWYFEYYIDDRPWPTIESGGEMPEWDEWWWKVGYQTGLEWRNAFKNPKLTLYLEYTRIDNYTYTSWHPGAWTPGLDWSYNGHLLGDPLGPDADRLNLEICWANSEAWQYSFAYIQERHGQGELGDHWVQVPGETEFFLTGIIETTDILRLGITRQLADWSLTLVLGLAQVDNAGNVAGQNDYQTELGVYGKVHF